MNCTCLIVGTLGFPLFLLKAFLRREQPHPSISVIYACLSVPEVPVPHTVLGTCDKTRQTQNRNNAEHTTCQNTKTAG